MKILRQLSVLVNSIFKNLPFAYKTCSQSIYCLQRDPRWWQPFLLSRAPAEQSRMRFFRRPYRSFIFYFLSTGRYFEISAFLGKIQAALYVISYFFFKKCSGTHKNAQFLVFYIIVFYKIFWTDRAFKIKIKERYP